MAVRWPRWASLTLRTRLTLLIECVMLALGAATGVIATIRTRTILETEFSKRGLAIAADLAMFSVRPLLANDSRHPAEVREPFHDAGLCPFRQRARR